MFKTTGVLNHPVYL